ncbi:MAG: efflux RND transporter periplasmic adaptor subunit [Planctomycetota bacterium]|jgi:Cu(I)/Ag(I) efflux system membrane fusion protein
MKTLIGWIVGIVIAAGAVVAVVAIVTGGGGQVVSSDTYFTCPMHPQIRLPQLGDCPICGMSLVKKKAGEAGTTGTITLTQRQIQLAGVRTEEIRKRPLVAVIDTVGRIDYDERRLAKVTAWVDGRIDKLHVDFTGATIQKGHPLADVYSPSLISAQEEYLQAVDGVGGLEAPTRKKLLWLGLTEEQVDGIAREKKVRSHLTIHAPIGGTVIHKHVVEGQYVKTGDTLFRIADLGTVWMYADIYESEVPVLSTEREGDYHACPMHPEEKGAAGDDCPKCGMPLLRQSPGIKLEITSRAYPGEVFTGSVEFTDPFVNPKTRTVRIRSTVHNPGLRLRPDMYVRASIRLSEGELPAIPESGVLFSGQRRIALIREGGGTFRPVLVTLGRMWLREEGHAPSEEQALPFHRGMRRYHELLGGVGEGDVVVTSGNFLVGSESQLQGALERMLGDEKPPAEGPFLDVLAEYLRIHVLLAKDELEHVPHVAAALAEKAEDVATAEAARALASKTGPAELREAFWTLSQVLIRRWKEHDSGGDVHVAYCPMVEKRWLQEGTAIRNPYDTSMPRCGVIEE